MVIIIFPIQNTAKQIIDIITIIIPKKFFASVDKIAFFRDES